MGILYTKDEVQCFIHENTGENNKSHKRKRTGKNDQYCTYIIENHTQMK